MKEFKLTTAKLKKAGKELQAILEPTEDDGITPLIISEGTDDEMKSKIIEGGNALTTEDSISATLTKVLAELGVVVSDEEETKENDTVTEPKEIILTWEDVNSMKKKELKKLCEERELVSESDDYEKIKDFRIDVAVELGIEVPKEKEVKEVIKEPKEKIEVTLDLEEIVNTTKKLADLKEIVENNDEFKKLRKGLKEYKGLSGPRKLKPKMLELLGVDVEADKKEVKKPVKEPKEKGKSKSETKREDIQKDDKLKKNTNKKSSVAKKRREFISELVKKSKYTMNKIVEKTNKKFPEVVAATIRTEITDGKNEKYCKWEKLIIANEKGILSFIE